MMTMAKDVLIDQLPLRYCDTCKRKTEFWSATGTCRAHSRWPKLVVENVEARVRGQERLARLRQDRADFGKLVKPASSVRPTVEHPEHMRPAPDTIVVKELKRRERNADRREAAKVKRVTAKPPDAKQVRKGGFMGCLKRRAEEQVLPAVLAADAMAQRRDDKDLEYFIAEEAEANLRDEQSYLAEHAANELLKAANFEFVDTEDDIYYE